MATKAGVCPACGAGLLTASTWLRRCPGCGFFGADLAPGGGRGVSGLDPLRRANFELLLDRIERHRSLPGERVLEVGSATGLFLQAASRRGAHPHGIEPEPEHVASSRAHGASVDTGMFPADLRDRGPYGVVVFNDVFEHIPDPGGVVREVARLLTPGGLLVLNVPSSRGVIFRIARAMDRAGVSAPYERLWQVGFPSPHLHYFSPENLRTTVERHTYLRQVDVMTLPSMSRAGLFERTRASMGAFGAGVATAALWPSTFLLDRLPADIHVGFFARTLGPDER